LQFVKRVGDGKKCYSGGWGLREHHDSRAPPAGARAQPQQKTGFVAFSA